MKKIWLILSLVVFLGATTGCKDDDGAIVTLPVTYPVEIPFEEYSLEGSACLWKISENTVALINSNEELEEWANCDGDIYPWTEIDFSKKTLILTDGGLTGGVEYVRCVDFIQWAENEYVLKVDIYPQVTAFPESWRAGLTVPKIDSKAKIALNVTVIPFTPGG